MVAGFQSVTRKPFRPARSVVLLAVQKANERGPALRMRRTIRIVDVRAREECFRALNYVRPVKADGADTS